MSYAPNRSRNGSLTDGMTDGGPYKKLIRDRGGMVEDTTTEARDMLSRDTISYQETSLKQQPDGTTRYSTGDITYHSPISSRG